MKLWCGIAGRENVGSPVPYVVLEGSVYWRVIFV